MEGTTEYYNYMLRKEAQPQSTAQYRMPHVAEMLRTASKDSSSAVRSIRINNMTIEVEGTRLTVTSGLAVSPREESTSQKAHDKKDIDNYYKIFSVRKMQQELKGGGKA